MKTKSHIKTVDSLRPLFVYDHNGKALLDNYGAFKTGLTSNEIDNYLCVRSNTMNIAHLRRKLNKELRGSTCATWGLPNGDITLLIYRHDVERLVNSILDGIPTYFD